MTCLLYSTLIGQLVVRGSASPTSSKVRNYILTLLCITSNLTIFSPFKLHGIISLVMYCIYLVAINQSNMFDRGYNIILHDGYHFFMVVIIPC